MAVDISMPEIYMEIRRLIEKQDARIADFVRLIETDSMLSVRVYRMANSDFFGFPRKATNLYQAIEMIGVALVRTPACGRRSPRTPSTSWT